MKKSSHITAAADLYMGTESARSSSTFIQTGSQYAAHQDMQTVLDEMAFLDGQPIETLSPSEARRQPTPADAVLSLLKRLGKDSSPAALVPGVVHVDAEIPGPAGKLPVRIYQPSGRGPFPVIVFFHGGGWVIADKQVYDGSARGLSKTAQAIVVSVDYRRAPEAKFPAAWDDALAAYKWVADNAASINGDPTRLALAGESAGGNLALATALAARDAGLHLPTHILAVYPVEQTGSLDTPSYRDSATAKPLNKAMIEWFVGHLLVAPEEISDHRLDLVNARLEGLPPVTIINAQIDPLREDGAMLADALRNAGVVVHRSVYLGMTHEFFGMAAVVQQADDAQRAAGQALRKSFGKHAV